MNRFVHRVLKSSTASSIGGSAKSTPTQQLVHSELQHAKLLYFGEFHSESRIVSFQTELIKEWAKCLASSFSSSFTGGSSSAILQPRVHLIMEHFSVDMQNLLNRFSGITGEEAFPDDDDEAFENLVSSYKDDFGTEGHDLQTYRHLLQFCRQTTRGTGGNEQQYYCPVQIHGGFIPRNHAARLNKECPDTASKKFFFDEMSQRGYLPKSGDAMFGGLFEDGLNYKLRGSSEHQVFIESLMSGADLYSPSEIENNLPQVDEENGDDHESPVSRLLQAQLLKDHAMGYRIASLMLQHHKIDGRSITSDRYIVIAGFGHVKHYLGVPECVNRYLRQEALMHPIENRRSAAMDLLLSITRSPQPTGEKYSRKFGGSGAALIGCQMMYEAYLEDSYPPMIEAATNDDDDHDDDDKGGMDEHVKWKLLKQLYFRHPKLMDEYILKSQEVSGPLLNYANGIAGFAHPCADYLFVYDEVDDNIIDDSDLDEIEGQPNTSCPFHNQPNSSSSDNNINNEAKDETAKAYEQVGITAYMRGNVSRARAIMSQLGYTNEDMNYIGDDDIYNFQGVANPHIVAKIQVGETVLDIGSGLGIDSFIAVRYCGAENCRAVINDDDVARHVPLVVGVDLALSEVNHAIKRASARGYSVPQCIQFICGDVEELEQALMSKSIPMGTFDVCISNGAFCLVPDKAKAFANVFKALKSGGRMAISTTTIVSERLDPSFEWPVCMRMFASLNSIKDMCESIGFKNVNVIDAESPMEGMEIPMDENEGTKAVDSGTVDDIGRQRFKIHGRYADQYEFLEKMNMDELCRVVTVYGEKP